jgi:hypothetical protein
MLAGGTIWAVLDGATTARRANARKRASALWSYDDPAIRARGAGGVPTDALRGRAALNRRSAAAVFQTDRAALAAGS